LKKKENIHILLFFFATDFMDLKGLPLEKISDNQLNQWHICKKNPVTKTSNGNDIKNTFFVLIL